MVRIKQGGRVVHQESRTFPGPKGERLARDWADRLEKRIKQDGVSGRKASVTTLGSLLRSYAEARGATKPLRRSMEHELEQLAAEFDSERLDHLAADTFSKFAMRRRLAGAGGVTILHNLSTVRAVLNAARPLFGLEVDGAAVSEAIAALAQIGAVSKSAHRDRRATPDELARLSREFDRIAPNPSTIIPMRQVVELAVALPRRLGELTAMQWVDLNANVITLRDTKNPKAPRTEHVPVPRAAAATIKSLPIIDARILPYKSESISASFDRACARLKIDDLHFHDLRHEGISRLFEAGLDIQEVAVISGHLSWAMLKRYTHLKPQDILDKLNASQQKAPQVVAQPA